MSHVFISYVRDNSEAVERLAGALRARGIDVWLDRENIEPGYRWKAAIRIAIREGAFFIACFSREYQQRSKSYMNEELTLAIEELRQRSGDYAWFIPVLLSACEIPEKDIGSGETLHDIQWVELHSNWDEGIRRIVSVINPTPSSALRDTLEGPEKGVDNSHVPSPHPEAESKLDVQPKPKPSTAEVTEAPQEQVSNPPLRSRPPYKWRGVLVWMLSLAVPFLLGGIFFNFYTQDKSAPSVFRDTLKDGSQGPEMVVIPAGQFEMGCVSGKNCATIVDDYEPHADYQDWSYSRIGTDRGEMGVGNFDVALGHGSAQVQVRNGWAGVWTSLKHTAAERQVPDDTLDPLRILGPYVLDQWQPRLVGIEVELTAGAGLLKVELKDASARLLYQATQAITGAGTLVFDLPSGFNDQIKLLNWIVDGVGAATVSQVRLRLEAPELDWQEKVFLYSYGHMSQTYDEQSGFMRDRATWPAEDFSAVQALGMFSLATIVAWNLGYVSEADAVEIVERAQSAFLGLPTCHGVLPHFVEFDDAQGVWQIAAGTEWSTIDTAISLVSLTLASEALGLDSQSLEQKLSDIDWERLTSGGTDAISHGYTNDCPDAPLNSRWDTFGSESFIIGLAYTAATGEIPHLTNPTPPTWYGGGFNDELAALFFPMTGIDFLGNDWRAFRTSAFQKQYAYFKEGDSLYPPYASSDLLSVSASEIPEPWLFDVYRAWGVGGRTEANDGRDFIGYPILAPHYAAMVASEQPDEAKVVFDFLEDTRTLSPLNNTESFGIDGDGKLRWNSLKGSWNLSLQTLGMGRALSTTSYLPYTALRENAFFAGAFDALMPSGARVSIDE